MGVTSTTDQLRPSTKKNTAVSAWCSKTLGLAAVHPVRFFTCRINYAVSLNSTMTTGVYQLKKRRPGCTGMFWRSDPTGENTLTSNTENWPRDDAMLQGRVVELNNGEKWLLVDEVKQAGENTSWIKAPIGAALPFEYDNHYYLE